MISSWAPVVVVAPRCRGSGDARLSFEKYWLDHRGQPFPDKLSVIMQAFMPRAQRSPRSGYIRNADNSTPLKRFSRRFFPLGCCRISSPSTSSPATETIVGHFGITRYRSRHFSAHFVCMRAKYNFPRESDDWWFIAKSQIFMIY